jgi:hypothetical protein
MMTSANNPSALPTAFPTEIFTNILGYCNDTIEDRQRKNNKAVMKQLKKTYDDSCDEILEYVDGCNEWNEDPNFCNEDEFKPTWYYWILDSEVEDSIYMTEKYRRRKPIDCGRKWVF